MEAETQCDGTHCWAEAVTVLSPRFRVWCADLNEVKLLLKLITKLATDMGGDHLRQWTVYVEPFNVTVMKECQPKGDQAGFIVPLRTTRELARAVKAALKEYA